MLDPALRTWLDVNAQGLDSGACDPQLVLSQLADSDVLRVGISRYQGGNGGNLADAVEMVACVASCSMTAASVLWAQRTFISCVLLSSNVALRERLLSSLLDGKLAGAIGLSDAIVSADSEPARIQGDYCEHEWTLKGGIPWVTNLRPSGFVVAVAIESTYKGKSFISAIPGCSAGVHRSQDLDLLGMQSSNTASLKFHDVKMGRDWQLHEDANVLLQSLRPAFIGMQCGLAIGIARKALEEIEMQIKGHGSFLYRPFLNIRRQLEEMVTELNFGLVDGRFRTNPRALFCLRVALVELATSAVQLELQATSEKGHWLGLDSGFSRRWRESAFLPVLKPTLVQLRVEMQRQQHRSYSAS